MQNKQEIVASIVWNNTQGVHQNLVSLGVISPQSAVSVDNVVLGLDEGVRRNGEGFLPLALDVPVDPEGYYAGELQGIHDSYSNRALVGMLTEQTLTVNPSAEPQPSTVKPALDVLFGRVGNFSFTVQDAFYLAGTFLLICASIWLIRKF